MPDGRVGCAYYAGASKVTNDKKDWPQGGRVEVTFSSDTGNTWAAPQTLFDSTADDLKPCVIPLPQGGLTCFLAFNSTQPPFRMLGVSWVSSSDEGRTWTKPARVAPLYTKFSRPCLGGDGLLLAGGYAQLREQTLPTVLRAETSPLLSWRTPIPLEGSLMDAQVPPVLAALPNGWHYGLLVENQRKGAYVLSVDRGEHWTPARPLPQPWNTPELYCDSKGTLWGLNMDFRNQQVRASLDQGQHWTLEAAMDVALCQTGSLLEMPDGGMMAAYAREDTEGRSAIVVRRFRLKDAAIAFEPFPASGPRP